MTSFGVRKFREMLVGCVPLTLVTFLMGILGEVLSGHFLGEDALAGVGLAMPVFPIGSFLMSLIGGGMGINYALRRGRLDLEGARGMFMQGVWTALFAAVVTALALYFLRESYFEFLNPTAEVLGHARDYWRFLPWSMALIVIAGLLVNCCYADGDTSITIWAYAGLLLVNGGVSWWLLASGRGTEACSVGLFAGYAVAVLVLSLHFLRASNTFAFAWSFRLSDSFRIVKSAVADASGHICEACLYILLGRVLTGSFGPKWLVLLPAFTVVNEFIGYADGFSAALQPMAAVYFGEGNFRALRRVVTDALRLLAAVTVGVALLLIIFPGIALAVVGISGGETAIRAASVVRWTAMAVVPAAILNLMNNYYQYVERDDLARGLTFFCMFLVPFAVLWGFSYSTGAAFWSWFVVARWGGALAFAAFLLVRYGGSAFPLLLDRNREKAITMYDLRLTEADIALTSVKVAEKLLSDGVEKSRAMRASLIVEETLMVVRDRNAGRSINAEVAVDLNDGVKLTIRDDGEIFDITDANQQVRDLRTFLVASVMERQQERVNLLTTGFNRNVYRF